MTIPLISIFIVGLLGLFQKRRTMSYPSNTYIQTKKSAEYMYVCFGILLLMHAFINPSFSDLEPYTYAFLKCPNLSWSYVCQNNIPGLKSEFGFRLFTKFISIFTSQKWIFLFCCGFIMLKGYYEVIAKYSPYILLSMLLITPNLQSMFVLRQHIAMGIVLLSYKYIIDKNVVPYLCIIALAYTFHQTALVFLPVYFIYNIKKTNKIITILFIALLAMASLLPSMLEYYATNYAMETAQYGSYYFEKQETGGTNATVAIIMFLNVALRFIVMKKDAFKIGINKLLTIISLMGLVLSIVGIGLIGTARMNMYYTSIIFLLLPNTLSYLSNKTFKVGIGFVYWAVMLYRLITEIPMYAERDLWFFTPYFN